MKTSKYQLGSLVCAYIKDARNVIHDDIRAKYSSIITGQITEIKIGRRDNEVEFIYRVFLENDFVYIPENDIFSTNATISVDETTNEIVVQDKTRTERYK